MSAAHAVLAGPDTVAKAAAGATCSVDDRPKRRLSRVVAADVVAIGDFLAVAMGSLLPALLYGAAAGVVIGQITVLQSTLIAAVIVHLCLRLRGMYDITRMSQFPDAPGELIFCLCCGLIAMLGVGLPAALRDGHLLVWYTAWISASFALILINRAIARRLLGGLAAAGRFDERVAVYGAGPIARRVHDYLTAPSLGVYFAGVFDDRAGSDRINPEGLAVSGSLDDLVVACREGYVDRIIVALPQSADARLAGVVEKFERLPVSTHIVTHIASDLVAFDAGYNVSTLGPIGLIDVKKKI